VFFALLGLGTWYLAASVLAYLVLSAAMYPLALLVPLSFLMSERFAFRLGPDTA
jgi:hypothetical protein